MMYATLTIMLLAAAPEAAPADAKPAGKTPADSATLLKTFRDEFVAITPGTKKFPAKQEIIDGKRTRTLVAPPAFLIAKYEVPQNLWKAVMGSNPSKWPGPRNSVEMLSFDEAQEFCKKATDQLRAANLIEPTQTVRLPTETEWEYAARAGSETRYYFGDDATLLDEHAWHTGNAKGNDPPVGAKKPNAWGLYDIHGYLSEWCELDAAAPAGAKSDERPMRGGSWKDTADDLAIDVRRLENRKLRDDAVGLRCVLTVPATGVEKSAK